MAEKALSALHLGSSEPAEGCAAILQQLCEWSGRLWTAFSGGTSVVSIAGG